ncbi:MAG: protein-L-isoaspartate(D-aspartate) O-methyltransferase [Actinomycetota bacterium]
MARRRKRTALVEAARRVGVSAPRVLDAIAAVPREAFVPPDLVADVDEDRPLPIGEGQTTSQPSLIAAMVEALELTGEERVLEVGTGYGYEAALLAHLAAEVHTIERHAPLAEQARQSLAAAGIGSVTVHVGDGTRGLPEHAPFDAIIVAAATHEVPDALASQLVDGGRLIAPVGGVGSQQVIRYVRGAEGLRPDRRLVPVRFVPLVADE